MKQTLITFVIITFLSVFLLTGLHDPILHGAVAYVNGWDMTDFDKGILTGYTNVTMTAEQFENTPPIQVWAFFMAPALILFFGAFAVVFFNPHRLVAIIALILMFLNLASLSPERLLPNSDASQALNYLVSIGVPVLHANILHWGIFFAAIIALATFAYIMFENDQKDSEKRIKVITK